MIDSNPVHNLTLYNRNDLQYSSPPHNVEHGMTYTNPVHNLTLYNRNDLHYSSPQPKTIKQEWLKLIQSTTSQFIAQNELH